MRNGMKTWIYGVLCAVLVAAGCGGGGGGGSDGGPGPESPTTVTGAAVKGLIKDGTVTAYQIVNGQKGAALGSTTTDADGRYRIELGTYVGPILVEVTGGSYKDEATGKETNLTGTLRAAFGNASGGVTTAVTPLTELAVRLAEPNDGLSPAKINDANKLVSELIGGNGQEDMITQSIPVDVTSNDASSESFTQKQYGLFLAAISQMADTNGTPVMEVIDALSDDLKDITLDETGDDLQKALTDFMASGNAPGIGAADATALNTSIADAEEGLDPTGDLAEVKRYLAAFLEDPTDANYNAFMVYMTTFVPQSKEARLFTGMAQLYGIYTDPTVSPILQAIPLKLDTNYNTQTEDFNDMTYAQFKALTIALIENNNLPSVIEALMVRLDAVDSELRQAEGVNASISLTGFDTVYVDDIDVKLMRTFTLALKAALIASQAVDLTSVGDWNVTVRSITYDIREFSFNDTGDTLKPELTDNEEAKMLLDFLQNPKNASLLTYRDKGKLAEFKTAFAAALSQFNAAMDSLNALGEAGRAKRFQNAFNISTEYDFYSVLAVRDKVLPAIQQAFANRNASLKVVDDTRTDRRYVVKDGYAYEQETHDIYTVDQAPVSEHILIYDMASGNNTPREALIESLTHDLADQDYDTYVRCDEGVHATVPACWQPYASGKTSILWDEPIDTYTVPAAAITIDGNSDDWAAVPVFYSNKYHTVKLARDGNNYLYVYIYGAPDIKIPEGAQWEYEHWTNLDTELPGLGYRRGAYAGHSFWCNSSGDNPGGHNYAYDPQRSPDPRYTPNGASFLNNNTIIGGEVQVSNFAAFVREGSCNSMSWYEQLWCSDHNVDYSISLWKKVKLLPEIAQTGGSGENTAPESAQ